MFVGSEEPAAANRKECRNRAQTEEPAHGLRQKRTVPEAPKKLQGRPNDQQCHWEMQDYRMKPT